MKTEVKLTKQDWEDCRTNTIELLKNAMAKVTIYKVQLKCAEKMIAKLPDEEIKERTKPVGVG